MISSDETRAKPTLLPLVRGGRLRALAVSSRDRLLAQGAEPASGPPDDLRAYLAREIAVWSKVIREAGVQTE